MKADYSGQMTVDERARQLIEALESGMGLRTTLEYEQRLAAVDADGTRTFEIRWYNYDFNGEVAGKPIPQPPEHVEATRALLASTATMRTTPGGRTLDVTYSDPQLAALSRRIQRLSDSMPTYLPDRAVAIGESWSSESEFPTGLPSAAGAMTMVVRLEHTLREVREGPDGPLAVIGLAGSYSQLQGAETGSVSPMQVQLSLSGSTLFDIDRGRFISGHYELNMLALQSVNGIELELTGFATGQLELVGAE